MKARVLILGASGLLGYPSWLEARERWGEIVHGTYRTLLPVLEGASPLHRLDLRDGEAVASLLRRLRPKVVVNCAGIVKAACDDAYSATLVNAAAPHLVAECLKPWNGRLVQVSTDCVFSGRHGGYSENDVPDPVDLYGRSKLLGEVTAAPHLTVRTSFIGFEPATARSLLAWFLGQQGRVQGYRAAIWSGLTADHLARILVDLADRPDVTGLLNVAGDAIDKDSLLRLLATVFDRADLRIVPADEPRIDRSLDASRLRQLGVRPAALPEMLRDLRRWGIEHRLYAHRSSSENGDA